jgi:hypothetical protein
MKELSTREDPFRGKDHFITGPFSLSCNSAQAEQML